MSRSCGSSAMTVGGTHGLPEDPCEYNPEASSGTGATSCDAHMNWRCGGHPDPVLPLTLGKLTISTTTDWPALVQQILDGACPRSLERKDEGPWLWLSWLHAYLAGLPVTSELSRADRDERVIGAVLIFFRRFPTADGISQLFAHANADPASVAVLHAVPETDLRPSLWNILIGMLQNRTAEHPVREAVDLSRKVMLTSTAGTRDPLEETLSRTWEANALRLDDAEWMSENIVALEAAGPGRWKPLMNLIVAFARNDAELESMIVIAGVALIQRGRVPAAGTCAHGSSSVRTGPMRGRSC